MASNTFTAEQKKGALWIIAFLVALRFVGIPLLDYQAEQKQRLLMTTQQLERAQRLLDAEGSGDSLEAVRKQRTEWEERLQPHTSDGDFRLQAQQRIQRALQAHGTQVELFDWLAHEDREDGYLRVHLARLNLQGEAKQLARAQLNLLEQVPGVRIVEYTLTPQRASGRNRSRADARVTLLIEIAGVTQ